MSVLIIFFALSLLEFLIFLILLGKIKNFTETTSEVIKAIGFAYYNFKDISWIPILVLSIINFAVAMIITGIICIIKTYHV